MKLGPAIDLCKKFEGFSSVPYLCPAQVWTIGYGSTYYPGGRRVTKDDSPITKDEAEAILLYELEHTYAAGVRRLCPGLEAHDGPFAAAVDFTYNLGVGRLQTSTLRRKLNEQDWAASKDELRKWVRAGGKVLRGLVLRREAEAALLP